MTPSSVLGQTRKTWSVAGASVLGASHRRRGTPNQDAIGWREDPASGLCLLAVADGHGSRRHPLSEIGARQAVAAALAVLAEPGLGVADLPERIVQHWRAAILDYASSNDDWILSDDEHFIAYGTTLLAARIEPDGVLLLQIGDGDILAGCAGEGIHRPLPDDDDQIGEATHSLCEHDAVRHFRCAEVAAADFVMLSTDGVGKSFAATRDLFAVAETYRTHARDGQLAETGRSLEGWLQQVSERGSGDDATLLMAASPATPAHKN